MSIESQTNFWDELLRILTQPEIDGNFRLHAQALDKILAGTAGYEAGNALKLGGVLASGYALKSGTVLSDILSIGTAVSNGQLTVKNPSAGVENVLIAIQGASSSVSTATVSYNQVDDILRIYNKSGYAGSAIIFGTNNAEAVRITKTAELIAPGVYAATTASAANTFVGSDGKLYRSTSTRDAKTADEDMDPAIALKLVELFRAIWYRSLCPGDNADWSWYGAFAEDIAKIDPRFVHWGYRDADYEIIDIDDGEVDEQIIDIVPDDQTTIEIIDGIPTMVTKPIEQRIPRVVEKPVVDESGHPIMVGDKPLMCPVPVTQKVSKSHPGRQLKEGAQLSPVGVQYERFTVPLMVVAKLHENQLKAQADEIAQLKDTVAKFRVS